jgi:hypothetical protein
LGRADVERKLHQIPGNHLVIVRYKPEHEPFAEWVYNQADIDHARVIWAREMAPSENQELLDYFKDRRIWLLEADENPARLSAYITEPNSASYGVPLKR